MQLPLPSTFNAALSNDRLAEVARWLLEELDATEEDLVRSTDSGYGRGCTTFDRQKNRIISEWKSGKHSWLEIKSGASFAVVMAIGGVPCRFSNDDPSSPKKDAVLFANRYQQEFLEFAEDHEPGQFCFIVDRSHLMQGEARVEFHGFTPTGSMACRWVSDDSIRVLRVVDPVSLPQRIEIEKPIVELMPLPEEKSDFNAVNPATPSS